MNVTFITGNAKKAEFLAKHLGLDINHKKLHLDELQSLDLHQITEHKARQAFDMVKGPVLVEDVSLVIKGMGRLPGPFIRWFVDEMGLNSLCRMVDGMGNRDARAEVTYAYFDGIDVKFFDGTIEGSIAKKPGRDDGFGWNPIFFPSGSDKTLSDMDEEETKRFSLRTTTVFPKLKTFLSELDKK